MAYTKHTWVDGTEDDPGKGTTIKATWMNEIEDELETLENENAEVKDSLTYKDISSQVNINSDYITAGQLTSGLLYASDGTGIFCGYFRLNAGSYTTDITLMTFPVKPKTEIQVPVYNSTGSTWYLMTLATNGVFRFQGAYTLSANSYMRPMIVFPIA